MNIQRINHDVRVAWQRWSDLPPLLKPVIPVILGAVAVGAVYRELTVSPPANATLVPTDTVTPLPPEEKQI